MRLLFIEAMMPQDYKKFKIIEFHFSLAEKLVAGVIDSCRDPGRPSADVLSRLTGKHFPYQSRMRWRCYVCAYKKRSPRGKQYKDKKIMTWSPKCEVHLCVGSCLPHQN